MRALAIDTSAAKFCVAAKNGSRGASALYDIGTRQSELLLPAVDYVLEKSGMVPRDLDFAVVSAGPGSFTGLRLAFAACKALTLANGTPLYAVPTLEAMAWGYRTLPLFVVPVIDAKKERFYAAAYLHEKTVLEPGDYGAGKILEALKDAAENRRAEEALKSGEPNPQLLLVGNDAPLFMERVNNDEKLAALKNNCQLSIINSQLITDALFEMAQKLIDKNVPPARDYDAPLYIRASEAEEKLLF